MERSDASGNAKVPSYRRDTRILAERDHKVELRMDEITSKFKNAFERMAELESLQLSMEQDSEECVKEKWFRERDENTKKANSKDKEGESRSFSIASTTSAGGLLIRAKEERLSPGRDEKVAKTGSLDLENEYDLSRHENRHDVADERGFPPEWSYEEQFKKVSYFSLIL